MRYKMHKGSVCKLTAELPAGLAMKDLPYAGPATKIPPPMLAGQTIRYRSYNDAEVDEIIEAVAVCANGLGLQWAEISRETAPRAMVGSRPIPEIVRDIVVARESWLQTRAIDLIGARIQTYTTEELKSALRNFQRRVFSDREELWVDGKFDSTFTFTFSQQRR